MAITANVDLGNGVTASSAYLIIPAPYVKKFKPEREADDAVFKLIFEVDIYKNKADSDTLDLGLRLRKRIRCRTVDNFKIDYDPTTTDNPWKLAYTHLKTNSSLSSVADA
tara:strand:+ start:1104 stop:1433 length:330 start_codon:yes stop_codon:yes gene_type:complete